MSYRSATIPAILLCVAACSAADVNKAGPDVTDLTASEYRFAPPASVQITPAAVSIPVGGNTRLAPVLRDSHGARIAFAMGLRTSWTSSDTSVATVSPVFGTVQGVKDGVATIKLVSGSASGSATVTVGKGTLQAVNVPITTASGTSAPAATAPATSAPATSAPATSAPATSAPAAIPPSGNTPAGALSPNTASTPVPPASLPPASSNSGGSGLSGYGFLYDDFTRYSTTADLFANISQIAGGPGDYHTVLYTDGRNAQMVQLDKSVLYNGHPTMKYPFPAGTDQNPELWPFFKGSTVGTMWLRAKIKFSAGFTTTGTLANSANAYKLLGWNFHDGNGRGGVGITNTTQYQLYGGANTRTGAELLPFNWTPAGYITSEWIDSGWYDYILEYHVTSATTATARFWAAKDGQAPVLRATTNFTAAPGNNIIAPDGVELGLNFNQVRAADQTQAIWYGQWEVVDGDQHPDPFRVSGGSN